ncbi:MAG: SMI1/KNR4 family protein [Polyangiaceae bacterium]
MKGRTPFEGFSLRGFWRDSDWAKKSYVEAKPSAALVASIEEELGYALPRSYVWLMTRHNGGTPARTCFPTKAATSWAPDHVAITGLAGIGRKKRYSLSGEAGTKFWIGHWQYPPIGLVIATCPSAGHDLIMLDYRACGPRGEPSVVHVDQEHDYRITPLAKDFETFIRGLVDASEYEEDEDDREEEDLAKVRKGKLSPLLRRLCAAAPGSEEAIRVLAEKVVREKGFFALHGDAVSREMYDAVLWLYAKKNPVFTRAKFLSDYEKILALAGEFSTGGYAPDFVTKWFDARVKSGALARKKDGFALSPKAATAIARKLLK